LPYYFKSGQQEALAYKVALIRPPGSGGRHLKRVCLGLASICSYLRGKGFECRVFDAQYHCWDANGLVARVAGYKPHLVGLSAMTCEIHSAARIARRLRGWLKVPAVIGGCHATALPRRVMDEFPSFDFGVYGEGERVFLNLALRLRDSARAAAGDIKGLIHREGGEVTINAREAYLTGEELGDLPLPALDDYFGEMSAELKAPDARYGLLASRGGSQSSCFDVEVLGRIVRLRPAESVVEEMQQAMERWGAHTFEFYDRMFFGDREGLADLFRLMIDGGLSSRARWSASIRPDQVSPSLILPAAKAGCFHLDLLAGSGDDRILDSMGRGVTAASVRAAVAAIRRAGIEVNVCFVLGHPGETEDQAKRTAGLARSLDARSISLDLAVPYPGTDVYEMALRHAGGYRLVSSDWSHYHQDGECVLELKGLSRGRLRWLQHTALAGFYLKNLRLLDLAGYLWRRLSVYSSTLKRKFGIRFVTKERFTG
jgi:radical SAM superfamily enzyme YgiQ (UPF0313 family)